MTFPRNTYVVLDIPSPFAERILEIRERQGDFFRWSLPVETTVCGSNGTGPIATDEDPDHVYGTVYRIATETARITTSFGPVRRFPDSDVFYLSFVNEGPFRALHHRLATSGLRFSPVPFAFDPHVTLRTRTPVSDAEAAQLLATFIPGKLTLDTMSVYQLLWRELPRDRFETLLCLLYRVRLTGGGK